MGLVFYYSIVTAKAVIWINSNYAGDHNLGVQFMKNPNRIENEKIVADYLAEQELELDDEDFEDDRPYYNFRVTMSAKDKTGVGMFDTLSTNVVAHDERDAVALAILEFQHEYDPDEEIDDPVLN